MRLRAGRTCSSSLRAAVASSIPRRPERGPTPSALLQGKRNAVLRWYSPVDSGVRPLTGPHDGEILSASPLYRGVPGRIAVIEDEEPSREFLYQLLTGAGFTVQTASGGAEGIALVEHDYPDLVLLDLEMPAVDGFAVCKQLRNGPAGGHTQIVILSAHDGVDEKVRAFQLGADDYLVKPVAPRELVARVRAMLSRAERLRQEASQTRGRLVVVAGAKGGIGTSTAAMNITAAHARANATDGAVLADLAVPVGTLGTMLGMSIPAEWVWKEFVQDGARSVARLANYLLPSPNMPLRLLPGVRQGSPYRDVKEDAVSAFASALRSLAEFVVVDLGNQPSPFTPPTMREADVILIVVEPEPICMDLTAHLLERLQLGGILPHRIRLVISNPHGTADLSRQHVCNALKTEAISVIPYLPDEFSAASKLRLPVILHQPRSTAAAQFQDLVSVLARV